MEFLGCANINVDKFDSFKSVDRFDSCQKVCCYYCFAVMKCLGDATLPPGC